MSNKFKKEVKNKNIFVNGLVQDGNSIIRKELNVIITNDNMGKTLSIDDGTIQFSIPFEPIEKYLI